ncbi:GTP-binding protein [Angomonas deanei]|uniref:Ferrous iron transport protein B/50S ribosome-binding GTPase, putative n=1 Tax=Angomonas deanei TaxID=59799 RepID=A0A7G2C418_9TRYP|nr:GTP-binding protein [Angomonas deanei]CAD2214440.1 Ferrous iron transport protein B/50S ribosome-binding GTPase, putative [Angomonas deanei]|eukprot:EPY28329.1 GTP-binding protein [Angomonas deanei]
MEVLLLEGGQGGKGNAAFANKWHHSPVESTHGLPGNTMLAQFELKSIADCGLVGYPNAGKSSLLGAISTSKPTVAHYAFTTLRPYIGVLYDLYGNTCHVADIPGLVEGAFENRGLGHQFLRHIERSKTLAFVVDMYETYNPDPQQTPLEPWEVVQLLTDELEYYLPQLSERAILVFANKMDLEIDPHGRRLTDKLEELRQRCPLPVFPVSAAMGGALGVAHEQAGFTPALEFLCEEVFKRKKSEREGKQFRESQLEAQLYNVFKAKNNGIFAATEGKSKPKKYSQTLEQEWEAPGEEEGYSLVDQQLGDLVGHSGLGEVVDGYEHSQARNKLIGYRDLTMRRTRPGVSRDD